MKKITITNLTGQPILLRFNETSYEVESVDDKGKPIMVMETAKEEVTLEAHGKLKVSKEEAELYAEIPNLLIEEVTDEQ